MTQSTTTSPVPAPVDPAVDSAVRNIIAAYCHALDDGRTEDIVALYTSDAEVTIPGFGVLRGTAEIRTGYAKMLPRGPQRHLVGNTLIQPAGELVRATSDVLFVAKGEKTWSMPVVGRYSDTLSCEEGAWLFSSRSITF